MSAAAESVEADTREDKKPDFIIYYTVSREGKKDRWQQCGVAWANSKGGYTLELPTGNLVMMPRKEDKEE